ncbi:MAG TPA: glycosyltransferase family 4 protein [Candidatus Limnocylindria bacterium]|nr:glycosyltransferase family 4 protein [Candidatus Limnocylindria bacterium]
MRVIHVAPTAFGSGGLFGGGERYPLELARALAAHIGCELVTFGAVPAAWSEGELRMRVLRPLALVRGHPGRPIVPSLPRAIGRADIIHLHQMRSPASVLAALTARVRGRRAVVTDHGLAGSDWGGLVPRLYDRFLTVSRYSAADIRAPMAKTRVIYGGVDPDRFRPEADVQRAGLLFVGRLTPHKGVDVLIRALPPGAELTVVGSEGHDRTLPERGYPKLLRSLAAGRRVRFAGAVDDAQLAGLYRRAVALVLPSVERTCYGRTIAVSELLGLVALEAMASGTPVIASRLGGLPEVVEDGETGFLVPPGEEAALRQRMETLLQDPALAADMGAQARQRVLARWTWAHCAERCRAAYAELLAE